MIRMVPLRCTPGFFIHNGRMADSYIRIGCVFFVIFTITRKWSSTLDFLDSLFPVRASWVYCIFVFLSPVFIFLRRNTYCCTPPRLRLLSLRRAVWPILTHVFGYVLFVLPARTRTWPPLSIVSIFYFRYGSLPRHSVRACCTLHPDLLCDPHCQRLSFFPLGPCFFVASSLVFISLCTVFEMILSSVSNHHCRYLMALKSSGTYTLRVL